MNIQMYSNTHFDRATHLREFNDSEISKTKKYIPIWNQLFFFDYHKDGYYLKSDIPSDWITNSINHIFLGIIEETAWYCVDISHVSLSEKDKKKVVDIRKVFSHLNSETASLLAYAKGIMHWYKSSLFCGICGSKTKSQLKGHSKSCTNLQCNTITYPQINPAIITLIEFKPMHEPAMCLLNRSKTKNGYRCSTLAGFVEIGESLEDAVRREMKEEVNVDVKNIKYIASQPWPFPSTLMIGFFAEVNSTYFKVDNKEIKDAKWYTVNEIETLVAKGVLELSKDDSIAQSLIKKWVLNNK